QLSAKARGIEHGPSHEIAYSTRSLAIDLFNDYDMLFESQRLTELVQELFTELPEFGERVGQDANALADISQRRKESGSIDPIRTLCESVFKSLESNPRGANNAGLRLLKEGGE